jgi:hypothetical protein
MTAPARPVVPRTEAELVEDLVRLLRARWPVRALGAEVRSHGRCRTDVCALLRDAGVAEPVLVGVEAKLSDWSRAVAQAAMNRYAVDVSYVAMPVTRTSGGLLEEAARHGVGVLSVGPRRLEVALPATVNTPDPVLRERVLAQLALIHPQGRDLAGELAKHAQNAVRAGQGAA